MASPLGWQETVVSLNPRTMALSPRISLVTAFVLGMGAWLGFSQTRPWTSDEPEAILLPAVQAKPAVLRGRVAVQRGETVHRSLERAGLVATDVQRVADLIHVHRDLRRIPVGFELTYTKRVWDQALRSLEAKLDPDHTLEVRVQGEKWDASVKEVPVVQDTVVLAGDIQRSLYTALVQRLESDLPEAERIQIVDILADQIFAWKLDFSRDIHKDATFRILYERLRRPDGSSREGRITAVRLETQGRTYRAYHFSAGGVTGYYDEKGEAMRAGFLKAPLEFRRISSAFSTGRFHPVLKRVRAHHGIDYAAASGTPVRAVGDGFISKAGWGGGYGNVVEIKHSGGFSSRYAHLKGFARGIRTGSRVLQGQVIGYVGTTGLSTGPHLHYEFHHKGRPQDPARTKVIGGEALPKGLRAQFDAQRHARDAALGLEDSEP